MRATERAHCAATDSTFVHVTSRVIGVQMSVNYADEDLSGHEGPALLRTLGFEERWQETSDPGRLAEFSLRIPPARQRRWIELVVLYRVELTDSPFRSWSDNQNWGFLGVFLRAKSADRWKRYQRWLGDRCGVGEDERDFWNGGVVARTRVPVVTRRELRRLVRLLAPRSH